MEAKRIHSLKYLMSTTLGCKNIGIIKLEFVVNTQFPYIKNSCSFNTLKTFKKIKPLTGGRVCLPSLQKNMYTWRIYLMVTGWQVGEHVNL